MFVFLRCFKYNHFIVNKHYLIDQETNSDQLLHSPEQLADDFMSQPAVFMNLLHANYLCHFKDIDDIVQSTDMLSIADVVLNEWRVNIYIDLISSQQYIISFSILGRSFHANRLEHCDSRRYGMQPKSSHRLATHSGSEKVQKVKSHILSINRHLAVIIGFLNFFI